ncbi:MAG: formyltransferase family protein [Flexilinea sp.]
MLVIAGKNNIACDILKFALAYYDREKIKVVLNKTDNGTDGWQRSLKKTAEDLNVEILSLAAVYPDNDLVFLSLEFDILIRPELFSTDSLYNIHFSLLPKYRGMYTSAWPILNNETLTGVTLHRIDRGIDTGDIIDQQPFPITFTDTGKDLYEKYLRFGTDLVKKNFTNLLTGNFILKAQNKFDASYYSRKSIDYRNLIIDLYQPSIFVYNQIRAFSFDVYQIPQVFGREIFHCEISDMRSTKRAGTIVSKKTGSMTVATLDYDVILYDRI